MLTKIDLTELFSFQVFSSLTEEHQKELSKYLIQDIDLDEDGICKKNVFLDPQFRESISTFEDLLSDGLLNSSKNFKEEIKSNMEINEEKGYHVEGMDT